MKGGCLNCAHTVRARGVLMAACGTTKFADMPSRSAQTRSLTKQRGACVSGKEISLAEVHTFIRSVPELMSSEAVPSSEKAWMRDRERRILHTAMGFGSRPSSTSVIPSSVKVKTEESISRTPDKKRAASAPRPRDPPTRLVNAGSCWSAESRLQLEHLERSTDGIQHAALGDQSPSQRSTRPLNPRLNPRMSSLAHEETRKLFLELKAELHDITR